jgi:2-dehydropantoate 2-reductase
VRILIYGAGALGQAVGCLLAAGGHRVDLILRERFRQAIRTDGLAVTGIFGEYRIASETIDLYTDIESVLAESYDFAIITTKSYDTAVAIADLDRIVDQTFTAVTMQNGCGNLELIVDHFGLQRSIGARVITGFEIQHPGLVKITVTADDVHIGGYREGKVPDTAKQLAKAINDSGLPCQATGYVRRDLFAKLLYNSALNPLGAILGVHYGALGDDPDTRLIMDRVIDEAFCVIEAMGETTPWRTAEQYRAFFYSTQLPITYEHRPSMLQDIENSKPTEIDAFTGYLSEQGRKYNVSTPYCDLLSGLVRFKERQVQKKERVMNIE